MFWGVLGSGSGWVEFWMDFGRKVGLLSGLGLLSRILPG